MYYLDTNISYINFEQTIRDDIYVDKSMLIEQVSQRLNKKSSKYICITRPRRFGKTINANMLGAYYTLGYDAHSLFDQLKIADRPTYEVHINKHHVIYIDFSRLPDLCNSFDDYMISIQNGLKSDLESAYPQLKEAQYDSLSKMLIASQTSYIFILDEWDSIFYKGFMTEKDKYTYLEFLKGLLKDQPYVELAYMTGILPIAKYSTGSELNMFDECSFLNDPEFEDYFGFNEMEVKALCEQNKKPSFQELKYWYDGYYKSDGSSLFNPRSVSFALRKGFCKNYWTETGPMNEIANVIEHNVDEVKEDIVRMISGESIIVSLKGYSASELRLSTRDEILSAMVVYGFLSYHNRELRIPNYELMQKFEEVLDRDSMGDVAKIVKQSEAMLKATLNKDGEAVANYLEEVHDREIPFLTYNDENSLSCVVTLCYLYARNYYDITRETKSGKGYVDYVFRPKQSDVPPIIIELKYDSSAGNAIEQIKEKNYMEKVKDAKEILLVGINYDKKNKKHTCIIESYQAA